MEEDIPFSSAVIGRLQKLSEISLLHTAQLNYHDEPTETHLDTVASAESLHTSSVQANIETLDELIKKQEASINELRAKLTALQKQEACTTQKIEAAKIQALKNGSEKAFEELPWLPEEESGVNTLITLRSVLRVIEESRRGITETQRRVEEAKSVLRRENGWVKSAEEMEKELQRKIAELKAADRVNESDNQRDKRKIEEYEKMRKEMSAMSSKLIKELGKFVKERLGVMIAVEESGGPVVGSELDVETLEQYLEVEEGTTGRRGKAAKARERGQRRLDEIWGDEDDERSTDPEKKAGEELLGLIEAMLNKMLEDDPHAYTTLSRDSAASRFLVRSFVATLHPKDAMRIRLLDFAGKIEGGR